MPSDTTSDQQDSRQCGQCGAPLAGCLLPCPSCRAHPADAFGTHPAHVPGGHVPLDHRQSMLVPPLPARRIWSPSSRALVKRYDVIEEPVAATSVYQRLRQPVAVSVSVLVATAAVYLGFIHRNDARVGTPITVSGKVQAQNGKASVALVQKPDVEVAQPSASVVAQPSAVNSSPITPKVGSLAAQRRVVVTAADARRAKAAVPEARGVVAATPDARRTVAAAPDVRGAVVAAAPDARHTLAPTPDGRGAAVAAAPDARGAVAAVGPDTRRTTATTPDTTRTAAATSDAKRTIAAAPDARRGADSQPPNATNKLRADASRHLKAARANLQENNLSATKSRLSAAIAAQPENRDAQRMRAALSTREQQRDALLSLARGCGYLGRWGCVSHNASSALEIDASSKEAQRLVTLAMHQSELQIAPPVEAPPELPPPAAWDLITHH